MKSILTRKIKSAFGLLRANDAWSSIHRKIGENLRIFRLGCHRSGLLFYWHANGFRYAVVPGISETKEIYLHQQRYEKTEAAVIRRWLMPGDFAVDCGANVGLLSSLMAERAGHAGTVWAVEASPSTAAKLDAVLAVLRLTQVKVIRKAISDRAGEVVVSNDTSRSEANTILLGGSEAHAKTVVRVPATCLDELLTCDTACAPALLKLDIEGAEPLALKGWTTLAISPSPPVLVFEVYPRGLGRLGFTPTDIFTALPMWRYKFWHINFSSPNLWPDFPCGVPFVLNDPFRHSWPTHSNVIAVPREGSYAIRAPRLASVLPQ